MKFKDHADTAKQYNIGGGGGFWRAQPGENRIRILSEYADYGSHYIDKDNHGICIGLENGCKFCEAGDKPKVQFLMWVLVRIKDEKGKETTEVKLGQVGYSIIKQIGELAQSDDWGFDDYPNYDITIKRKGEKLDTEYFVQPSSNKDELTIAEQDLATETMKPLEDIISKMKDKAGGEKTVIQTEETETPKEEDDDGEDVNIEDIPF